MTHSVDSQGVGRQKGSGVSVFSDTETDRPTARRRWYTDAGWVPPRRYTGRIE